MERFYFGVILPLITYSLVTWANCSYFELFRSIDKLHGRAAKPIYNLGNSISYQHALKRIAKWHSLAYIYEIRLFKLMPDAYYDRLPVLLSDNTPSTREEDQKISLFLGFNL